jgi:two-component system, OmpR family, phosphate regulon sensor histidine kinase PhoR
MEKIRTRMNVSFLILIFVALLVVGLWIAHLFKVAYLTSFQNKMENEAIIIAKYVEEIGLENPTLYSKLERLSDHLSTNVTIYSPDGELINDTKREVKYKFRNVEGFHEEVVNGVYYYSQPVKTGKEVKGFIHVYYEIDTLRNFYRSMWAILFLSLGVAYTGVLLINFRVTKHIIKPIEDINRVALELANGNYEARTYEERLDETGELSKSINHLAQNLSKMTADKEKQTNRLQTLIENMGSGLLLINEKGKVSLVNREFSKTFGSHTKMWKKQVYKNVIPFEEVTKLIDEAFTFGGIVKKHVVLSLAIERKHFIIYSAPILNDEKEMQGVALLFHDITELKKLESMRKDFVANVSHELKTPMTSIKGFAETLLDGALEDKDVSEKFLGIILKEADRMQQQLEDLLELSKLEREDIKLDLHEVSIEEIAEETTLMLQGKAKKKDIVITSSYHGNTIAVVDQARVKQVFLNIINNAIAYTPEGGSINISLKEELKNITCVIKDSGIGIAHEQIPRIFERFYRIDKARSRQSGGTGLGLAIVKHIVEAHHGKIKVDSTEGKGTTFTISFPKNRR